MIELLLTTVTDHELLAGQVVKAILWLLFLFGLGYNLRQAWNTRLGRWKAVRSGMALFFLLGALFLSRWLWIDGHLWLAPQYTVGTTTGYCEVWGKGRGVAFEYQAAGKTYRSCNVYHPVPRDQINLPGGRYRVRYSPKFPEKGRMDFSQEIK
ncbi:MAG: hypothetical protein KIPDCIKN_00895 [Haliscomenobacter sp.]|jgi:hypothetical protein|nr:hypothetical protein [Haliscomenobacter sp.]